MGLLRRAWTLPAVLLVMVLSLSEAVTFEESTAHIYDIAPKLRIKGTGFDTLDASTLKLSFVPKLKADKDYSMEIQSSTVIVISLKPEKKWMELKAGWCPTGLYLSYAVSGNESLLEDAVQVATIVPMPTVEASTKKVYMKTTPRLIVNGANFNLKNTELFFDPPLQEGTVIQKKILSSTQISLTKVYKRDNPNVWASEPGPLRLVAIDTGYGHLIMNPEDRGVVIAVVQADLGSHGVTVKTNESLHVYQSSKEIQINGSGFVDGMELRFANGPHEAGDGFMITDTQPEKLTLELLEGSKWRENPKALPGVLVALAAEAGAGWVPLGPTTAKAGRKVATVFEDPAIEPSDVEIYRTHSHELTVMGKGFNKKSHPVIDFDPPIDTSVISIEVMNRTMVKLSLSAASAQWTTEDAIGPLMVKGMDTGAGMVTFDSPVTVATVVPDTVAFEGGSVHTHLVTS